MDLFWLGSYTCMEGSPSSSLSLTVCSTLVADCLLLSLCSCFSHNISVNDAVVISANYILFLEYGLSLTYLYMYVTSAPLFLDVCDVLPASRISSLQSLLYFVVLFTMSWRTCGYTKTSVRVFSCPFFPVNIQLSVHLSPHHRCICSIWLTTNLFLFQVRY